MRPATTNCIIIVLIPYILCAYKNNASVVDDDIVQATRELVNNYLNSTANRFAPGLVIGVSVKGERKWVEGFGLANVENNGAMTFALASRLMYHGKLDFDASIREYLSYDEFPDRMWKGSVANITLRQIFQMTAGFPEGPLGVEVGFCLRCENSTGRLDFVRDRFPVLELAGAIIWLHIFISCSYFSSL